ncbi:hypothetical protein [Lysobacter enzymogenes]|uniref:hypothetical protein n=1 Tax=Lysobacter enzymogenes TaxID=69 RepID=UPI001A971B41|nr:hypothetical protein [Lysobacter enzymogenes]QQP98343.1 hypothetical protein JHW38_10345 [Lysobacter enzymogenes]
MTAGLPQPPHEPGRQPTVAESLDAIAEWSEARKRRRRTLLLFYASVVVALVLAQIVLVNLNPPQPAQNPAPAPSAAAPTASTPAADPIADRAFDATLDRLQAESAASADGRERTRAHRSQLQQAIDRAGLELKIERFECGPRLCAAWLLGGGDAYDGLNAALPTMPQAPLRAIAGAATLPEQRRHPLLLSIGTDADAADTAPTAAP